MVRDYFKHGKGLGTDPVLYSRAELNFKDLKIGKYYKVFKKIDERGKIRTPVMKLVDINTFYISFLDDKGFRECYPNHIKLTKLEEV